MEILTLLGSPRKQGNTNAVLSAFEQRILPPHRVQRINLSDHNIHGCLGCDACQRKPEIPGCVQKDDAPGILQQMIQADVIVYATPLYVWDFSAQMKTLLDRHYCLVKWHADQVVKSFLEGKRVMLLVTCAGAIENNADFIQGIFEREMECAKCDILGKVIVPNCTTPQNLGDRVEKTASELYSALKEML